MRTLGQERSEYALKEMLQVVEKVKDKREFASFASGVPSMILQNGFGQTLAFLYSKRKDKQEDKYTIILIIIKNWLEMKKFVDNAEDIKGMILNISDLNQKKYLAAQKETLSLLEWVKRYAQAFKEESKNDTGS